MVHAEEHDAAIEQPEPVIGAVHPGGVGALMTGGEGLGEGPMAATEWLGWRLRRPVGARTPHSPSPPSGEVRASKGW